MKKALEGDLASPFINTVTVTKLCAGTTYALLHIITQRRKHMKGIILAGGSGTRLYPLTMVTSKQLLPIFDKPMIYYPMSVLMNAGIRDILIISTPQDTPRFEELLGDGHQFGVTFPTLYSQARTDWHRHLSSARNSSGMIPYAMVLGDNIFAGHGLNKRLKAAVDNAEQAKVQLFSDTM